MQDFDRTIISQYWNSPILTQIITNLNTYIDPNYNLQNFYDLIWNIDTAVGYGLDVWGRIVGIGRVLTIASGRFFGFEEANSTVITGFNVAPFYSGQPITSNFTLTDEAYRLLIFAKAAANITDGSIEAINQILLNLFPGRGNCYVIDHLDMTMTYYFSFPLEPFEQSIVTNSGVLPTPAGVLANAVFPP
jgi:hypothetical protein